MYSRRGFSGRTVVACSAAAAVAGAVALRRLTKRDLTPTDSRGDSSSARVTGVNRQVPQVVQVLYHSHDGMPQIARIDQQEFAAETRRQVLALEMQRKHIHNRCKDDLRQQIHETLSQCQGTDRVASFAGWYFAYGTTYELMRIGIIAAASSLPVAKQAAKDAVAAAVLDRYSAIVLRPSVTEPALRRCFERSVFNARTIVLDEIGRIHDEALPLLVKHTTHMDQPGESKLHVDWTFARGTAADVETAHARRTVLPTAALLGGGAILGKLVAGVATKTLTSAAAKTMVGKLASPFIAKASSAATSLAIGGAAASVSGPVGAAVGSSIGLAIDVALSKGVELISRGEMEADVQAALHTAQLEWQDCMEEELVRMVNVLLDDAMQLVATVAHPGDAHAGDSSPSGGGAA